MVHLSFIKCYAVFYKHNNKLRIVIQFLLNTIYVCFSAIARASGMSAQDVGLALHDLNMLAPKDGK